MQPPELRLKKQGFLMKTFNMGSMVTVTQDLYTIVFVCIVHLASTGHLDNQGRQCLFGSLVAMLYISLGLSSTPQNPDTRFSTFTGPVGGGTVEQRIDGKSFRCFWYT